MSKGGTGGRSAPPSGVRSKISNPSAPRSVNGMFVNIDDVDEISPDKNGRWSMPYSGLKSPMHHTTSDGQELPLVSMPPSTFDPRTGEYSRSPPRQQQTAVECARKSESGSDDHSSSTPEWSRSGSTSAQGYHHYNSAGSGHNRLRGLSGDILVQKDFDVTSHYADPRTERMLGTYATQAREQTLKHSGRVSSMATRPRDQNDPSQEYEPPPRGGYI
jgi:hypothetical protein